jgi:hypothetical protein
MASGRPFVLASAPVDSLDEAIRLCLAAGGEYTAGDAADKLNSSVIGADEAWIGPAVTSFSRPSSSIPL